MRALTKMLKTIKGGVDVAGVVVDVALVTALIPIINAFISDATNLTTTEATLLGLTTLFIILALVFMVVKQAGIGRKK